MEYLRAPEIEWTEEKVQVFDRQYERLCELGPDEHFEYQASYPKYEFFCYLVERKETVLHGTNNPQIAVFEPRLQTDYMGRTVKAVFATPDGIWPIFFAIVDRTHYRVSLRNGCKWEKGEDGERRKVYYFSVNREMLELRPWIAGTMYVLPRTTFEQVHDFEGGLLEEWISYEPVKPLGKVWVSPDEFPFLDAIEGHTDRLNQLIGILLTSFKKKEELDDGYGFEYEWSRERFEQATELLVELREIVPGVHGEIVVEPVGGGLWLRVGGGSEIKGRVEVTLEQLGVGVL